MIILITRMLLALQLFVAIGIAAALTGTGRTTSPAVALSVGIGVVLLLRLAITANSFYLSWRFRSETPPAYRLHWRQRCMLFFGEFKATMVASSVNMPFRTFEKYIARTSAGLPVLLIHGYSCNSGYWQSMGKALRQAGISHGAINMEPVTAGIDDYVPQIHQAVENWCAETGSEKIVIVAHSMGGLATRAYLRAHGTRRVARAVTLGTPHHGTAIAQFGIGLNTRQMRLPAGREEEQESLASRWLHRLAVTESADIRALFVSILSHHDNIIAPQTSPCLPGAVNIEFGGIGHVALASHPGVQACVLDAIREVSTSSPVAAASAMR